MAQQARRQPQEVRPKLTPQTLEEFMAQVRSDPKFKARAIESIKAGGLVGVAEEFFDLSDTQRDNLDAHRRLRKEAQDVITTAVQAAFETGGNVRLLEPVSPLARGISGGIHVGSDGSWSVDFSCSVGI